MDSRSDGAHGSRDHLGDLLVAHLLDKTQYEHFTLLHWKVVESRPYLLCILRRESLRLVRNRFDGFVID